MSNEALRQFILDVRAACDRWWKPPDIEGELRKQGWGG
jgi:hypothetical protein